MPSPRWRVPQLLAPSASIRHHSDVLRWDSREGPYQKSIIIEVPAIPHLHVWLNCRGQGYRDDVSIDATLSHDKGINRQCLCCRCCHRTQHESEGRHPNILKPSILFHNLSYSCLVTLKVQARRGVTLCFIWLFLCINCAENRGQRLFCLVMLNLGQTNNRF